MKKIYYYIAYGSNLNLQQMYTRCPDSRLITTGFLKGYELLFRGTNGNCFCTIEKAKGGRVPIGIFRISEHDKVFLDRYEGYPTHYRHVNIMPKEIVFKGNKPNIESYFVYVMNKYMGELGYPSEHYYNVVQRGYMNCGMDIRYLHQALQKSILNT